MRSAVSWFLAFAAVFAALAGFVFWGTWSLDAVPVMPDSQTSFAADYAATAWGVGRGFLASGRLIPTDALWSGLVGPPYLCVELRYVIGLFCAGLGLAYFLRGRGLSPLASYGAGLLLAFCGYWCTLFSAGHGGWFIWMTYGVFAFGLADRAVRKGKMKNWLLLGATVAWASFNQNDLWLLFTVLTAAYFIYATVREARMAAEKRPFWVRWGRGVACAALVFFAIGTPSFYDAFAHALAGRDKQIEESKGSALTGGKATEGAKQDDAEARWIFVTNWSLPPNEALEFIVPRLNGDTSCPLTLAIGRQQGRDVRPYTGALGRPLNAPTGNYRQHSLYLGWMTVLLALAGLVAGIRARRSDVTFFAVAALVFCLFSFGRYCAPVYRLVYALPFGDYLRAPVKWHHLTELCVCVLAGFGLEALLRFVSTRFAAKGLRFACAVVGAVVVLAAFDLARIDRLYCASVDMTEARRQNCSQTFAQLRRADFNNPQVAAMVKAKRIVPLANPGPDAYLVGVLQPFGKTDRSMPPLGWPLAAGVVSVLTSLGVIAYGAWSCRKVRA